MSATNDIWVFVEHEKGEPKKVSLELATKAEERGFNKSDNIVYLESEKKVAKLP